MIRAIFTAQQGYPSFLIKDFKRVENKENVILECFMTDTIQGPLHHGFLGSWEPINFEKWVPGTHQFVIKLAN